MDCPRCGLPMIRRTRKLNNQVYWWCKVCKHEEETKELGPQIWESWNHKEDE